MSDERLKPCPCCESTDVGTEFVGKMEYVICRSCGLQTLAFFEKGQAIKRWNTRKPMERIVEKLEKELELADKEKERNARENPLQFDSVKGYATGIYNAIEIVKGVERMSDCRVTKEEAIELLKAYVGNEYYTEKWQETCRMAIDALNGQAEPVVHGEWEDVGDDPRDLVFRCTHCKVEYSWGVDMGQENYCPNCGAKMKAGGQNE